MTHRNTLASLACLLTGATLSGLGCDRDPQAGPYSPLPIVREWRGEAAIELRPQAPASGYVASPEAWDKLWRALRGDEPLPEVDFRHELIIVAAGRDPNSVSACMQVNRSGDVKLWCTTTTLYYDNPLSFRYHFASVSRGGLRSVGGVPIAAD